MPGKAQGLPGAQHLQGEKRNVYRGIRDGLPRVFVNGRELPVRAGRSRERGELTDEGGATRLAFDILAHEFDEKVARAHHVAFAEEVVAGWPDNWQTSSARLRLWLGGRLASGRSE